MWTDAGKNIIHLGDNESDKNIKEIKGGSGTIMVFGL